MRRHFAVAGLAVAGLLLGATDVQAVVGLLQPGDAIIAIDVDPATSNSSYPAGEAPSFAVDGTLAKYLNFAGAGSGLIVTPNLAAGSVAEGIQLTTANDAEGRDPTSYELWGTNDAITSADNSTGLDESWTLISSGFVPLPSDRNTVGDLVAFANTDEYTSYKVIFPTNKGDSLFQIAEVELYGDVPGLSVFDSPLLNDGDPTLAVHFGPDSRYPGAEGPDNLVDGDAGTKYLNFGQDNSGFIVTPASGASVVTDFQITTANDFPSRDPASYEIYGTNDPIISGNNSQGEGENWTLIANGDLNLPDARFTKAHPVLLDNTTAYTSYRVVFPTLKDLNNANSMQIANFQFNVPEPSSVVMGVLAAVGCIGFVRRRR